MTLWLFKVHLILSEEGTQVFSLVEDLLVGVFVNASLLDRFTIDDLGIYNDVAHKLSARKLLH